MSAKQPSILGSISAAATAVTLIGFAWRLETFQRQLDGIRVEAEVQRHLFTKSKDQLDTALQNQILPAMQASAKATSDCLKVITELLNTFGQSRG